MIEPTAADIGREVLYVPRHGGHEAGVITSFNTHCVFVRYGSDTGSKATARRDLEWAHVEFDPLDRIEQRRSPACTPVADGRR